MLKAKIINRVALISLQNEVVDLRLIRSLKPAIQSVLQQAPGGTILDLSHVRTIDFSGVALLLEISEGLWPGQVCALVNVQRSVLKTFDAASLSNTWPIYSNFREALVDQTRMAVHWRDYGCPVIIAPTQPAEQLSASALLEGAAPVMDMLLVEKTIAQLSNTGLKRIHLATGSHHLELQERLGDGIHLGAKLKLHPQTTLAENGAQSAAQLLGDTVMHIRASALDPSEPVMVLPAHLSTNVDLAALYRTHITEKADATLLSWPDPMRKRGTFHVVTDGASNVQSFGTPCCELPHGSIPLSPTGVMVLSPLALDLISQNAYPDLDASFLPFLIRMGAKCLAVKAPEPTYRIVSASDLRALSFRTLNERMGGLGFDAAVLQPLIHPQSRVHPSARCEGPMWIGPNVQVGANAKLLGPLVLHQGVKVGVGAVLDRSLALPGAEVPARAHLQNTTIGDLGETVPATRDLLEREHGFVRDPFSEAIPLVSGHGAAVRKHSLKAS